MSASPDITPNFPLAEGFVMPSTIEPDEMRLVNEVFDLPNYTAAPLLPPRARERVFGESNPQHVGSYACNGFVIFALTPVGEQFGAGALIAPSPGRTEVQQLERYLKVIHPLMPQDESFKYPRLPEIFDVLQETGVPVATGVHTGVRLQGSQVTLNALAVPRAFQNNFEKFRGNLSPDEYAIKLSAHLFGRFGRVHLKHLRSQEPKASE